MNIITEEQKRIVDGIISNPTCILPFIGENAFYYQENEDSEPISIQKYLAQKFAKAKGDSINEDELNTYLKGYYGLSKLKKKYPKWYKYNYIKFIYDEAEGKIHLRKSIKGFIDAFKFPFIITTCCFDFLEKEIHYGTSEVYQLNKSNEILSKRQDVIYHIFGYVDKENRNDKENKWVNDEKTLLYYMKSLNNKDTGPKGVAAFIKSKPEKRVLFLGCNFPNWIFRFMWTPFNDDFPNAADDDENGYWLGKVEDDSGLNDFFEDIGYLSDEVVDGILSEAATRYKERNSLKHHDESDLNHDFDYDIFLSYASEDVELMHKVKKILENDKNQLHVWYSEEETPKGGDYWIRIQAGIEHSRYFMPIITPTYLHRFLNPERLMGEEEESGLETETKKASVWFNNEKKHPKWYVYSLPVIVVEQKYNSKWINQNLIEKYAKAENGMPQDIFFPVQMYFFSEAEDDARDTFSQKDWSKYRNNNR